MKLLARISFVLALAVALPSLKLYAQSFEGTITYSMSMPAMGDEDKHSMIINMKGQKVETETDMGAMGMAKAYVDHSTNKMFYVMDAMHMGYTADMSDESKDTTSVNVKATGKKDVIAGHAAEEYTFKISSKQGDADCSVWESKDFPKKLMDNARNMSTQGGGMGKAFGQLAKEGYFPVKIIISQNGETAITQEFVKYEEKSLDDALFVPPSDIKYQPMPGGHGMN